MLIISVFIILICSDLIFNSVFICNDNMNSILYNALRNASCCVTCKIALDVRCNVFHEICDDKQKEASLPQILRLNSS